MQDSVILISTAIEPGARSSKRTVSTLYGDALARAGLSGVLYASGDPIALASRCDGLLLSGGGDLEPALYGQTPQSHRLSLDPVRDTEELALLRAFCALRKPVLGICRGMQVINVAFGGTLLQEVAGHDGIPHPVTTVAGTHTARLTGGFFKASSYHHQAVGQLGHGLCAAAYAADGLIEALEHRSLPILGVQWHPERMIPGLCTDVPADHSALFAYFIQRKPKP